MPPLNCSLRQADCCVKKKQFCSGVQISICAIILWLVTLRPTIVFQQQHRGEERRFLTCLGHSRRIFYRRSYHRSEPLHFRPRALRFDWSFDRQLACEYHLHFVDFANSMNRAGVRRDVAGKSPLISRRFQRC